MASNALRGKRDLLLDLEARYRASNARASRSATVGKVASGQQSRHAEEIGRRL